MKKIFWMTIACFILFSNQALAHTGLESSTPTQGSTITEKLNEITLKFLTKIEATSSFTLTNSSNEKVNVEDITVSNDLLTGKVTESLENGAYQINWKIIGADGHPIEGVIDFVLEAPVEEEVVESTEPIDEIEPIESSETEEMATTVEEEKEEESSNSTIGIIIVLVLIIALAAWWMARRNKK